MNNKVLKNSFTKKNLNQNQMVKVASEKIAFSSDDLSEKLLKLNKGLLVLENGQSIGLSFVDDITNSNSENSLNVLAHINSLGIEQFGDPEFIETYGVSMAYMTGAMANGIASEEMVIASGKAGILSSFGSAGLIPSRIEYAIEKIQKALPKGPYAFNLIHSPSEEAIEKSAVELYLRKGINTVEASAFLGLTPNIVRYRVAGLHLNSQNQIEIRNRVIAKVSRTEVASKFMAPPPISILQELISEGLISEEQSRLASKVPMADDITVEADSGGHTDNRPLILLLPTILELKDQFQKKYNYSHSIRVGAAGGIGTPASALAAFMMGAAYVVTGSINQSCVEAAASEYSKNLLAEAEMADFTMAPAADMFEMGVNLQVLKRGTMFPMRAKKLYDLYKNFDSIDDIPLNERQKIEEQIFCSSLSEVWQETQKYFLSRDPRQIERAKDHPKRKMALIFRWYLGLTSHWSNTGKKGREADYQIWAGPAIGAFNFWVKDSYLQDVNNRKTVDIAKHIMIGAAYLARLRILKMQGIFFPSSIESYKPKPFLEG